MDLITGQEGQLQKLTITVCDDKNKFNPKQGDDFIYTALVNPDEIKKSYTIEYESAQPSGTTAADLKFKKQKPSNLTINLLFDGTGVLANDRAPFSNLFANIKPVSVNEQLTKFKSVVYDYESDEHKPNVLQIKWGELTLLETAVLLSIDITYTLFKPSGEPLRAKVNCTFAHSITDDERVKLEKSKSPDLTRIRTINEGDSLPLMCYTIYGDSKYYLEVARVNQLKNFRTLTVGDKIFFPPVDKTKV
jgi:hypothetical protein